MINACLKKKYGPENIVCEAEIYTTPVHHRTPCTHIRAVSLSKYTYWCGFGRLEETGDPEETHVDTGKLHELRVQS